MGFVLGDASLVAGNCSRELWALTLFLMIRELTTFPQLHLTA
jgi:hypothetical protein